MQNHDLLRQCFSSPPLSIQGQCSLPCLQSIESTHLSPPLEAALKQVTIGGWPSKGLAESPSQAEQLLP